MNISKLTINPVVKEAKRVIITNPEPHRAGVLIMDKLNSIHCKPEKIKLKKLPKFILDFVNPETRVGRFLNKHF